MREMMNLCKKLDVDKCLTHVTFLEQPKDKNKFGNKSVIRHQVKPDDS